MSSFSTTLGDASTLMQTYLEELQSSLTTGSAPPVFPTQLADQVATLSNSMSQFSGYQATYSEAKMNRSVELLRGVSRAVAVSNMTRDDFYANAISAAFTESEAMRTELPQVQASVDPRHPSQVGGLT